MQPALALIKQTITQNQAWKSLFDNLHGILVNMKSEVDKLLNERKNKGETKRY